MENAKPPFSEWIQDHVFSATELENYLACPYRFWAQHYLEIKPQNQWTIEISPMERGILLHRVLEKVLQVSSASLENLQSKAFSFLEHELSSLKTQYPTLSPFLLSRQTESLKRTLKNFLTLFLEEKEKRQSLLPKYFEWSFGHQTPALEIKNLHEEKILFKGRIDRIDIDPVQKTFLIIDYKTSGGTTGSQILAGHSFQLPLYILAVKKLLLPDYEPIGALYYNLASLEQKDGLLHTDRLPDFIDLHPSSSTLVPPATWDRFFEETEVKIAEIISQIRQGDFPSEKEPCQDYCPYQEICQLRSSL